MKNSTNLSVMAMPCQKFTGANLAKHKKRYNLSQRHHKFVEGLQLILMLLFLTSANAFGQNLKGVVNDAEGKPIPAVLVRIDAINKHVASDNQGRFSFDLSPGSYSLRFSYVGFNPKVVIATVPQSADLKVYLSPSTDNLDEVQVIGYGQTTRRLNTGSVVTLGSEEIGKQPVSNILSAMSGRLAGVNIQTNNGLPGGNVSIQIRGRASIAAGTDPLYVVDGVPYPSVTVASNTTFGVSTINGAISPLNSLNPNDIEQISVLKDADATAIYGSRGANGVVLITTKKDKNGKTSISVDFSQGINQAASKPKYLGLDDYLQMRRDAFAYDNKIPSNIATSNSYAPDLTLWSQSEETDWVDYFIGGTGSLTTGGLQLSGGGEQFSFRFSGNVRRESTILPGDNMYQKQGYNASMEYHSKDNKFRFSFGSLFSSDRNNLVNPNSSLVLSFQSAPNYPAYNADGSLNWPAGTNPIAGLNRYQRAQTSVSSTNVNASYQLIPGLNVKFAGGLNRSLTSQLLVNPRSAVNPANATSISNTVTGQFKNETLIFEPQADYSRSWGNHQLNILVGGAYQDNFRNNRQVNASNFASESLLENLSSAATLSLSDLDFNYKYASLFGRLNYNYASRYLLNFSLRRDGSSRFGPRKRFGDFGAVGAAWLFTNEKWFDSKTTLISSGKLRGSYGITGSDQITDYQYLSTYSSNSFLYQGQSSLAPNGIANFDYSWERNGKAEAGLELGFLADRINLGVNYYNNRSGNQLVYYNIPYTTGFNGYYVNLPAVVSNSGWEFMLSTMNINHAKIKWTTNFNISFNRNKLSKFDEISASSYNNLYVVGESLQRAYGYRYHGDELTGKIDYYTKSGEINTSPPSDSYYTTIGNLAPRYFGGLSNTLSLGQFQFDLTFQFSRQWMKGGLQNPGPLYNVFQYTDQRWRQPGDQVTVPAATTQAQTNFNASSANYFDVTYLRLKNAQIAWSLPNHWQKKLKLNQANIYIQGQNLLTFWNDDLPLYDPESGAGTSIPPLRTVTMGISIGL